jgi:hypothetical protein
MPLYRSRAPTLNFDEGLSALAKAFAPPTGAETYAFTRAASERAEAQRKAELYGQAGDPNLDQGVFDRKASIAGAYSPNQSMTAVNANNATTLRTNAADNATRERGNALDNRTKISIAMAAPITAKEGETVYLPQQTQAATGLAPTISGAFTLNQGQQANLPDGRVLAGAPKPLSTDELAAQDAQQLPIDDPMRRALGLKGVQTLNVQTPDGPRIATIPQAIGQAPAVDPSGKVTNYTGPNGAKGTAAPGANGKLVDTQTGAEVPAGSTVYSGQAQGTPDQFGKTTEAQDRYGLALKMTDEPTRIINDAFASNKLPSGGDDAIRALSNLAPGAVGTFISQQMSPEAQSFHNAIKNAVPYQLLALSGQGVTEAEYERTMARLIPFANDTPEVKAQKRNQFNAFREGIRGLAGPAAAKVGVAEASASGAPAAPAPPPAAEAWVRGPDGKLKRAQ